MLLGWQIAANTQVAQEAGSALFSSNVESVYRGFNRVLEFRTTELGPGTRS